MRRSPVRVLPHVLFKASGAELSADHPEFGRQRVQVLPSGEILVHSTSETVLARQGEDRCDLALRLLTEYGVGPLDTIEIVFKAGVPQYAVVEWSLARKVRAVRSGAAAGEQRLISRS